MYNTRPLARNLKQQIILKIRSRRNKKP